MGKQTVFPSATAGNSVIARASAPERRSKGGSVRMAPGELRDDERLALVADG